MLFHILELQRIVNIKKYKMLVDYMFINILFYLLKKTDIISVVKDCNMENRRVKINDILIYCVGIFIIYSSYVINVVYVFINKIAMTGISIMIIVSGLICYLSYYFSKNKNRISHRVNVFNGLLYALLTVAIFACYAVSFLLFFIYEDPDKYIQNNGDANIGVMLGYFLIAFGVYYHSVKTFGRNHLEINKCGYSFLLLSCMLNVLLACCLSKVIFNFPIPVRVIVFLPTVLLQIIGACYYDIQMFNSFTDNKFYDGKTSVKVFITNLFKRKIAYYFGVTFALVMGFIYFLLDIYNAGSFYFYIGIIFVTIAGLRMVDQIWLLFIKKLESRKRYINQYIMIFVNALVLLLISFVIRSALINIEEDKLGFWAVLQLIIIIIRVIMVVIGYYNTRINVKSEPYNIALNNMSMISLFISIFALLIPVLVNLGVGQYDLDKVIIIISYIIFALIHIIIILMVIRGIIGLIKLKNLKNSQ